MDNLKHYIKISNDNSITIDINAEYNFERIIGFLKQKMSIIEPNLLEITKIRIEDFPYQANAVISNPIQEETSANYANVIFLSFIVKNFEVFH